MWILRGNMIEGDDGNGAAHSDNSRWMRLTERCARTAESIFRFDVQEAVAKSKHAVESDLSMRQSHSRSSREITVSRPLRQPQ